MADTLTTYTGRGPEGEFSIDLPNWARETTQVKIDKKLGDLNKKFKDLPKNMQSAFESALKKNVGALNQIANQNKKEATATAKRDKAEQRHRNQTQQAEAALLNATLQNAQAIQDLEKITNQNNVGGGSLANLVSKAGPFGKIFQLLTKSFGMLAGVIQGVATAALGLGTFIASQLMKTFNMLNRSLSDGTGMLMGAFTDSTVNVAVEAAKAGMSLSEFTDALAENSEEIRVLGTEGFRELRNAVRDNIGGMFDLGYSQEEITTLLGREISIRQRLGMRLDIAGSQLEDDVVLTSRELRSVANAAGVNAEVLYQAAKLTDETNTLISARARQFGDEGISDLFTSIRQLSLRISGLAPTFGSQITSPLVNAMVTGAIGLDEEFTQLVTVFPGLVDAFETGRADIMAGGKLTEESIDSIMESLVDTTDEQFERAKMLALMTRNQTAIQAVNFANEVRAREKLLDAINDQSVADRIRDAATINQQVSQFFDILKAPFETFIPNFLLSVLGVSSTGTDLSLASVIEKFTELASKFVTDLPVFGKFFDGSFFGDLNQAVTAYFDPNATSADRERARARINELVTQTISDIGQGFNEMLAEGTLMKTITEFFRNMMDEIIIAIAEGTKGRFFGEAAIGAYARQGDFGRMQDAKYGLFGGGYAGKAFTNQMIDLQKDVAAVFGVSLDDLENFMMTGAKKGNIKNLSDNELIEAVNAMNELNDYMFSLVENADVFKNRGKNRVVNYAKLQKALEDGDLDVQNLATELFVADSALNAIPGSFGYRDNLNAIEFATPSDQGRSYLTPDMVASYIDTMILRGGRDFSDSRAEGILTEKALTGFFNMYGTGSFRDIIADGKIDSNELASLGFRREEIMKEDPDKPGQMIGTGKFQLTETGSGDVMRIFEGFLQSADKDRDELAKLRMQMNLLIQKIDPDTVAGG